MIRSFKEAFPDFISAISARPQEDAYNLDEVFIGRDGTSLTRFPAQARMKQVLNWLEASPSSSLPLMPCDSASLDQTMVRQIEDHLVRARTHTVHLQQPVIHTTAVGVVLSQTHAMDCRSRQERNFSLADRVVYIRGSGPVPFGARGTVVSMCGELVEVRRALRTHSSSCSVPLVSSRATVESFLVWCTSVIYSNVTHALLPRADRTLTWDPQVLFDEPFLMGTSLDGRCTEGHGAAIGVRWLLNVTRREMLAPSEATTAGTGSKKKKAKGKAKPKAANPFALLMD